MPDYKIIIESELQWLDEEIALVRKRLESEKNVKMMLRENMLLNEKERLLERIGSTN